MDKIETFIHKRFPKDCNWTTGNCYYFAIILKERFGGTLIYDTINCHFLINIHNKLYDWNGRYQEVGDEHFEVWNDYMDHSHKQRIIKQCIM